MAEVTRRRTGELVRKLFEILMTKAEGMRAKDALESLVKVMKLTDYEAGDYTDGYRRFERIVRFGTVGAVKAGWLVKNKGTWIVTEAGQQAHARFTDPELFYREAIRLYQAWRAARPQEDDDAAIEPPGRDGPIDDRDVARTFEEAEEEAWQAVEKFLNQMNPYDFQELVAGLLRAMGYHVAWVAPPGKDGGVDILAFSDPLGTRPPRIKVQVKRQQSTVAVDGLRSFMAVLGSEDVGLFVNTGGFTKDAQDEARSQATRKVTLVGVERLYDLWIEYYEKLDDVTRRRMPLRPVYFLAPAE